MSLSKEEMLNVVVTCAEKYEKELLDREFLILFDNKKEVLNFSFRFSHKNFLHLTGLRVSEDTSAIDFYKKCRKKRLSVRDFEAAPDGTTELKLKILPQIINKNLSVKMIGDYNSSLPKLYTEKLIGGEKACLGFICDKNSGFFCPKHTFE